MTLVVTGMGAWTAAGRGVQPLRSLLHRREHAFSERPPYPHEGLGSPWCGIAPGLERERPAETLLLAVANDALVQAGLTAPLPAMGLVVGTTSGNISGPWERWHRDVLSGKTSSETGCGREAPTLRLAAKLGLTGPVATLSLACASGTAAFALASGWLADGLAPAVLVVGLDALSLYIHAGFNGLGALSEGATHPFQADRDGLTLGEGAAALVVEPSKHAARRGAKALGVVLGVGLAGDARHMTAPHPEGRGAAAAMRASLADAGVRAEQIDMVSVHGTGTVFNDQMEAKAL
ncbi:MAG: hypothetical protein JRJ84_24670, partial [Deltaproteobacteria bacterium]|nr:hypothetical protein [Deltaproteobacteria bacterium]